MTPLDIPTLLELLVVGGVFSGLAETARWFISGRGRARVDNAKIVQGMAIDLVQPIHIELAACRANLADLRLELDSVLGYALIAHALLETAPVKAAVLASGRTIPSPPPSVLKR
jgi:hypothetical protein